ncbi:ATP-binding cassette domain-containing protein [bacterium]|nr:MAG: ATP-binding cassette domain-containing protein [bacterium]
MEQRPPALIDLQRVSVMRGRHLALRDVTLRIEDGERVAILGPNGSGKSTLIKTITRECYPLARAGSHLSIFGLERWNVFELRTLLGIVSNDLAAAQRENTSGLEVVLSGFFASVGVGARVEISREMRARALHALERLDAGHLAARPLGEMSSGEGRRVLIARALVHEPRALLFDEPSTSLDLRAQRELRSVMSALARSGLGIVLVTHQLADVVPEIDRVVLLSAGGIAADGPKTAMLTEQRMSELFGVEVQMLERDGSYRLWDRLDQITERLAGKRENQR